MMYKSKFKLFGQTGFIVALGLFMLVLAVGLLIKAITTGQEVRTVILVGVVISLGLLFIWNKILTEIDQITITDSSIEIVNVFTKRKRKINRQDIKGFKDSFKNGYTILIVDHNERVLAKIHDYYYQEFIELKENLGIKYLERVPTFWNKLIKVESNH